MSYEHRVRQIAAAVGDRDLVWFGTRGEDARPLLALRALRCVVSQIAPLASLRVPDTCLETLTRTRVDLDRYSVDRDRTEPVRALRRALLAAFARPAVVIPYRPCGLVASALFPRLEHVFYAGVFHELQSAFEHKPWVESSLRAEGIPVIRWSYVGPEDVALVREAACAGPIVLRSNHSDGGAGLRIVSDPDSVGDLTPTDDDRFFAVSRFLAGAVPLNVNACVFRDGQVRLHGPSVQLIGIPACSRRALGYCGNDYGRFADLEADTARQLDTIARATGRWLRSHGYLGAFGVDALLHHGVVRLVEVNPRFQGSSATSARLDRHMDRCDLYLDHLAAHLGVDAPEDVGLLELAARQGKLARVVCHNTARQSVCVIEAPTEAVGVTAGLVPAPDVVVEPEGTLFDLTFEAAVTTDGMSLLPAVDRIVRDAVESATRARGAP